MKNLLTLIFVAAAASLNAQGFIAAVSQLQPSKDCHMELNDGTKISGEMRMAAINGGFLNSLTLRDANGEKHKYKAADIKWVKVKAGALAKMDMMVESSSSIKEIVKTDFNEIVNREYIIYEQALLPKKKDKYRLLQLLNPGFDSRIKVYNDPNAKETSGIIGGGEDKSYLVVKDGQKAMLMKKSKYKKEGPLLFGDCEKFMSLSAPEKYKFKNFAGHIYIFDQLCSE